MDILTGTAKMDIVYMVCVNGQTVNQKSNCLSLDLRNLILDTPTAI